MNSRTVLDSPQTDRTVLGFPVAQKPTSASDPQVAPPYFETDDGVRLFYRDWGTGKAILFVHSWAMNSDQWQYQMAHLSSQALRCIAYDRRGHGRSSDPGRGYTADRLADDLAELINGLGLYNLTLVGHSMGCGEIVRYLARHGSSRVERVALIAPSLPFLLKTPDNPEGEEIAVLENFRTVVATDFPKWLSENARPFFVPDTCQTTVDWGINMCLRSSLKAVLECNRVDAETDYRADLSQITVPAIIIQGDRDVSTPLERTGIPTARLIPHSKLIVYEGAPHGLMLTHVDRLNGDLRSFIWP